MERYSRRASIRGMASVPAAMTLTKLKEDLSGSETLSSVTSIETRKKPSIEAVNLTKRFGERVSVDHLNLKIHPGEVYALLGDNGAGKTTTINMLTTLLRPTEGHFYICGHDGVAETEKTKGMFGIVSQDVAIYNELTAYENLQFIADLYGLSKSKAQARIKQLLDMAGLTDRANDLAGTFSGGMQRKLSIANALLHEPQVLFMDEPTVGLDPAARLQIWEVLMQLRGQGVAILLTTHYLDEAEILADRIGIIRLGKLVAEGTIGQLREKIQAIRSIEVRLSRSFESVEMSKKLANLDPSFRTIPCYDALHNTITFAQPKDMSLSRCLGLILAWLDSEKLPFSKYSTNEPSLEEVFLALAAPVEEPPVETDLK
jgi:ABC-2 type transport system ATP-binding protein